jgi:integrase/recombinase XerD
MVKFYYSIYGPLIEQFIALKTSLGYKYRDVAYILGTFDQLAHKTEQSSMGLFKQLTEQWCRKRPNESEKTWYNRIQVIRQFSSFLSTIGYPSYSPELPHIKSLYTPYIFSKAQIESLFSTCDQLRASRKNLNSAVFVIPVLFRVLYGTGIRISEALSLCLDDVYLQEFYLILRNCKNGEDRLVPISESLAQVCKDYLNYRNRLPLCTHTERFFVHPDGSPCDIHMAYKWFRRVLYKAGIAHGGRGLGPRLHDLRHTFSVHALSFMAEGGADLYYSLPVLCTYLGHRSLAATDKYVRLTAEMYPSLISNVNKACPYLFPDINNTNDHETY